LAIPFLFRNYSKKNLMKQINKSVKILFLYFITALVLMISGCYQKTILFSEEENDMYDGPGEAAKMEFERTKDPATGKVPRELLLTAIEKTRLSKLAMQNSPLNINALTWQERGSNSDAVGPSNGNTRANGGITSGRIRAVWVDLADATGKTVWVGGVDGGLWKTTDITVATPTWTLVNDFLSNLAVTGICQDPTATNIMYFCTGEAFFNFEAVNGNGVFKSTNGGVTWAQLPITSTYTNCSKILCDAAGNIYLATVGAGFLRSTKASGGAAWLAIQPTGFSARTADFEISSTGRLHISVGLGNSTLGAYRYTDAPSTVTSATWTTPATPFTFPSGANCRLELGCSGNTLYALPSNTSAIVTTVYKSTDGGANWTSNALTATNITDYNGSNNPAQAWYSLAIDIDPSNTNNVIIGNLNCLKSTDGAVTWTKLSEWVGTTGQYVHADQHIIKWYDNGNKLLIGCDGGIHYSADKGVTIRDKNTGLRIKQFYSCAIHPTTTNYFLAGAQDNGVHQFNNAGLSSSVEITGGDGGFVAIDQNQPQYQFGSYVRNIYRKSIDGGLSWSTVSFSSTSGQFINPFDYDNNTNIMYCGDVTGAYRRWTDPQTGSSSAVVTITALGTGNVTAVSASPYTANRAYFGTDLGKIVQVDAANTIASGSAGTDRSTGLPAGTITCINQGTSDQNLIACYSNYGIANVWASTDGGTTWTSLDNNGVNLPDMPVRWAMFYPGDNTKAYIATETGVWETTLINGATTVWAANNTFPAVRTDMIKYRSSDGTIAAATHGRGLWTATIPLTTTPDIQFQSSSASATEATTLTSGCRGYTDYTANMTIANPPTGAATVTLGIAGGGTASPNFDYAITTNGNFAAPSMVLTFANGVTTPQPFTVRIYDDAALESPETFTLNYIISGATNAQPGTSNQTFTFTINDNDVAPIGAGNLSGTIGTFNTNLSQPFRGSYFDSRTQMLYGASELAALGFSAGNITSIGFNVTTKSSTQPYNGFTIKLKNTATTALAFGAFETGATQVYSSNYSTVAGLNTFTITPFAWDGVSNLLVDICWDNTTATVDDLVQGTTANPDCYYDRQNTNVTPGCSILSNAFIFSGGARPLLTLAISTTGTSISTALNSTKTAYLGPNDDVYFYDAGGNIMARIKNLTAFDYGCTAVTIDRAGSATNQFWNNSASNNLLQKSIKVVPTNNTASGHYQISLYYTGTEVGNWQTATGQVIASAQAVKVSNGFFIPDVSPAAPHVSDVTVVTGTSTVFGTNYTIMGDFNNTGFSGFGVGIPGNPLLTADFRTKASGNITDPAIWQYNNSGAGFIDAAQAPGPDNNTIIQAAHIVALNAGIISNAGKTVTVNGVLNCGTNTISGAGAFTLSAGGTLGIGSPNGISTAAASGNILVTGLRTFPVTANYTYNGAANQAAGNGLPATINNLVLANTGAAANNIFSLGGPLTVNGTTTLTSGILSIGANTLTIKGATTYGTGLLRGSSTSNLTIGGIVGTINFDQSAAANRTINILTVTGTGSGISGSLILTAKTVNLNPGGIFTVPAGNVLQTN
jgi:hypothetical protein